MRAAELTASESRYKAQAERYLAETQRILRHLQQEHRRNSRRRNGSPNVVAEVKRILGVQ